MYSTKLRDALEKQLSDLAAAEAAAIIAHRRDTEASTAAAIAGKPLPAPTAHVADAKAAHHREVVAALQGQLTVAEDADRHGKGLELISKFNTVGADLADRKALALAVMQLGYAYHVSLTNARPVPMDQLFWIPPCCPDQHRAEAPALQGRMQELASNLSALGMAVNTAEAAPFRLPSDNDRARAAAALADLFENDAD